MSNIKENKMGTMPVNLLLITMTLPMMASMLVQALYNIVDSMFVAKISEEALTALSLAFPVQNLMIGVATGTGVGMNALLSRSLGEKDYDRVNKAAGNGILLVLLASVLFILFGIFGSRLFFSVQTDDAKIIEYGVQYVLICCVGSPFLYLGITFERLMQSTGKTVLSIYYGGGCFNPLRNGDALSARLVRGIASLEKYTYDENNCDEKNCLELTLLTGSAN